MIIRTAQPTSGSLTVLVVEDEPLLAFEVLDELARLGQEGVGPVMAGRDVMAVHEERRIDFAFVDINLLDGRTGIDVGRYLKVHGTPYAFLTATGFGWGNRGCRQAVCSRRAEVPSEVSLRYCLGHSGRQQRSAVGSGAPVRSRTAPQPYYSRTSLMRGRAKSRLKGKRIVVLQGDRVIRYRLQREFQSVDTVVPGPATGAVAALELNYAGLPDRAVPDARVDARTSCAVAEFLWLRAVPFTFMTREVMLAMPSEFQGRRVGTGTSVTDIADAHFGRSMNKSRSHCATIFVAHRRERQP